MNFTPGPSRHANATAQAASSELSANINRVLASLNLAQLKAVEHDPTIPLQILAGPGSGKTKVLTSRIARLITTHKLPPSTICAVTFTNKAANEMRDRLTKLIGKSRTTALQMGTFHSICARYLRMYSAEVKLDTNFTICDADESKRLINTLLKPYADYMVAHDITISEGNVAATISKAKAKGQTAAIFYQELEKGEYLARRYRPSYSKTEEKKSLQRVVAEVYIGYEQVLKDNNALDYDDLLIYGVKLFTTHKESALWCRHILVDEFQDTNTMQYELMKAIAIRKCVTIVGDPDQSIYGWRSAEVVNLSRMRQDFPSTQQIFLEQNYRSTASILRSCLAIVAEDKNRIPKSLHTSHPLGSTPFIGEFSGDKAEADFIADEIKRCTANMGGVLRWGDFAILLRFNALSRPIESALQKSGIPCRILGGHKFFERMEVKDILSYLQLADNPSFNPAFIRAVKVPARGLGDKSMSEIASQAQQLKVSQLELVEKIHDNKVPDTKPSIKKKIVSFVKAVRCLRKLDEEKCPPSDMIRRLVDVIGYEDHLKKTQQDWESRWENVQELITFASEVEEEASKQKKEQGPLGATPEQRSILRDFLQASSLSSEGDNETEDQSKEKVTISTCHAAKGLEWPAVIIPSVDRDTFPFYRTEDVDEERRLLYVACTRAQTLLYILFAKTRVVAGRTKEKKVSDFVSVVRGKNEGFFTYDVPRFLPDDRAVISTVLSRPIPDETEVERRLAELEGLGDRVQPTFQTAAGALSTVSLTGVRSSIKEAPFETGNLSALYAAPDALAEISAAFMKDYNKKIPFNKRPKPPSKPSPFTPTSGVFTHSIQTGITTWSPDEESGFDLPPVSHLAESSSSRQGDSNTWTPGRSQPTRQIQALDQNKLSSGFSRPSLIDDGYSLMTPPKLTHADNPFVMPSAILDLTSPVNETPRRNSENRILEPLSKYNRVHITQPVHISKGTPRQAMTKSFLPSYDQTRPLGESSSGPRSPVLSNEASQQSEPSVVNYDMASSEPTASSVIPSQPKGAHYSVPSVVSNLPTAKSVATRTEPSLSSQPTTRTAAPETAGVKRRLGMGRMTNTYSNKKFKHPV